MSSIGYATVTLIPSFEGLDAEVNKQLAGATPAVGAASSRMGSSMGTSAARTFGTTFKTIAGGILAATGIQSIVSGIGDAVTTGLKAASFQQSAQSSLTVLTGSATTAKNTLAELSKFAANTPFDLQGSVTAAQRLLGAGASAKSLLPTLTALGDANAALGGTQDSVNESFLAWSQLMTRGKLDTQDLYQLSNAGIPIWKELAKAINVPVSSIQDMVSSGTLLSDDTLPKLQAQLEKDYGGSMARQAKTLAGTWSTVKDTVTQALGTAFKPLAPMLATVLPPAANALANAITGVSTAVQAVGSFVKSNMTWIGPITVGLGAAAAAVTAYKLAMLATKIPTMLATAAQWALNLAMDANPIGLIITAVAALVAGLVWFFTQTTLGKQIWQGFVDFLVGAWNWIVQAAQATWNWIVSAFQAGVNFVIGYVRFMSDTWTNIWNAISGFVSGTWNAIVGFIVGGAQTAVNFVLGIGKSIQNAFSGAINWLASVAHDMWQGFVNTWNRVVSGIADIVLAPFRGAIAAVKALLGIHSPSRVMGEIAGNVADGFINGLNKRSGDIADAYGVFGAQSVYGPAVAAPTPGSALNGAGAPIQLTQVQADGAAMLGIMQQVAQGELLLYERRAAQRYSAGHL
jgi:tape measure domain-containing protein